MFEWGPAPAFPSFGGVGSTLNPVSWRLTNFRSTPHRTLTNPLAFPRTMVEFETLETDRIEFGTRNFIEVARKVALDDEDRHEFVSVSRGYTTSDGYERWKANLTVPDDEEVKRFIADQLLKV